MSKTDEVVTYSELTEDGQSIYDVIMNFPRTRTAEISRADRNAFEGILRAAKGTMDYRDVAIKAGIKATAKFIAYQRFINQTDEGRFLIANRYVCCDRNYVRPSLRIIEFFCDLKDDEFFYVIPDVPYKGAKEQSYNAWLKEQTKALRIEEGEVLLANPTKALLEAIALSPDGARHELIRQANSKDRTEAELRLRTVELDAQKQKTLTAEEYMKSLVTKQIEEQVAVQLKLASKKP
jgi:hypothetical protein